MTLPLFNFLAAGQSNMSGRGSLSQLPAFQNLANARLFTNANTWDTTPQEPSDSASNQVDAVSKDSSAAASPLIAFADALCVMRPDIRVGLVPCAKGGSTINDWARDGRRTTLYGSMLYRAGLVTGNGEVKGLLFYQGEGDAGNALDAEWYPVRQKAFLANVRADFGPTFPVVVTALGPLDATTHPYRDDIRAAQFAAADDYTAVVDAGDLTRFDSAHLNTASLVTLGGRYAAAMAALLA